MKIIIKERFNDELNEILAFIAKDSLDEAVKFYDNVYDKIHTTPFMSKRFPKNRIANQEISEIYYLRLYNPICHQRRSYRNFRNL